jgi:hypothetical protein
MTYAIKNTLNGRTVRDAISGKPLSFSTEAEAQERADRLLQSNRLQAAFSLKTTEFSYTVIRA